MSKQQEQSLQDRPKCTITEVNKPNIERIAQSLISIHARKSRATKK
ncbi:hypothetical protein [Metabacillus bambusae]|uniref:Uncharacterized protein n=1 Tax=Metabacillus bambusae TaxID=2795218 RepID=A0ABS3N720_9BACI|nr:hypothetical protein [Metabacillus bambusae]MBO1513698.1 hypothetical protein [Metabacillus bambusae]